MSSLSVYAIQDEKNTIRIYIYADNSESIHRNQLSIKSGNSTQ